MAKRTQAARMLQKVGSLEVRPSLLKAGPRLSAVRKLLYPSLGDTPGSFSQLRMEAEFHDLLPVWLCCYNHSLVSPLALCGETG